MEEASWWARALATAAVLAFSFAVIKFIRPPQDVKEQQPSGACKAKKTKRRSKRIKKPVRLPESASSSSRPEPDQAPDDALPVQRPEMEEKQSEAIASESSDSDDDDRRSAIKILSTRKFKPAMLGRPSLAAALAASAVKFEKKQKVLARFGGGQEWFPATILEVCRGNEYHLQYDDGAVEYHIPQALIKLRPEEEEDVLSDQPDAPIVRTEEVELDTETTMPESSTTPSRETNADTSTSDDDGWQVVSTARPKPKTGTTPPSDELPGDGLTKRQRESRRKRERKKELKELARSQAQEHGLHPRWGGTNSKLKYVPPPTQPPKPTQP